MKTYSTMNGNLLFAFLSVCWCVVSFSSAIKDGILVKGMGSGLVTILKGNERVCTGVVVHRNWILTAGKCVDDRYLHEYRLSIRTKDVNIIDRRVLYTERPANSTDVVLIKTKKALKKKETRKIVLGNSASDNDYIKCKLLGYSDVEQPPVKAFLMESAGCDNTAHINRMCFDAKRASVCSDDTGAPVVCRTSESRFLVGLALVEGGCSTKSISAIRISFYERWIRQVIDAVDCGNPNRINFGTIDLDVPGQTTFAATASVNCNPGYIASASNVSCASDGMWSPASCDIVDCGNPYNISFGTLDLDVPGKTTFAATASVNCNAGFNASANNVSCASDGMWSSASCNIGIRTWIGSFMSSGKKFPFSIKMEFQGNVIKGSGLDGIGEYTIEGTVDVSGEVVFLKQYIGLSIRYQGKLNENGCEISGTYTNNGSGYSDTFTMRCE